MKYHKKTKEKSFNNKKNQIESWINLCNLISEENNSLPDLVRLVFCLKWFDILNLKLK
jgi:hypothetical protein